MASSGSVNCLPAPRAKRQRPHLARLSSLLPSSWTAKKTLHVTVSPSEAPLRSLLISTKTPATEDGVQRLSPTFVEPERDAERQRQSRARFPSDRLRANQYCNGSLPLTPRSAPVLHPRSSSDTYSARSSSTAVSAAGTTETLHDDLGPLPAPSAHRRSNSSPASSRHASKPCGSNAVWLCSPPTGKRAERPLVVRASAEKCHERNAKALDDVMSVHSTVTATTPAYAKPASPAALAAPAPDAPRCSMEQLPPGIYRLHSEQRLGAPAAPLVYAN